MTLLDRARSFFKRDRKLTDAAIQRTKVDESICSDMRRRATKLGEAFEQAPAPEGTEYAGWEDLLTDAYCAHVGLAEPKLTPEDSMKPSGEMRRRAIQSYVQSESFQRSRPGTRDDALASAFATLEAANTFRGEVADGSLTEHAEREQEMAEQEQRIDELEASMEKLGDDDREATDELLDTAIERLAELAQEQEESGLKGAVATVAREAAEKGERAAEIASRLPGMGPGSPVRMSADDAFELADRWTGIAGMWELAQFLGRAQRSMVADRSTRAVGGHEELVGIERGDDLSRVLPSELMRMRNPRTRRQFYLDYFEGDLMQHASIGEIPKDRGPIIVVKDGSSSMKGKRFQWATAVSLALVNIAHTERRDSHVIEFGSSGEVKSWSFPAGEPLDARRICDCAEHFFNGGTDIYSGMFEAHHLMHGASEFAQADIALLTDGEDGFGQQDEELRDELRTMGVRIVGVAIAQRTHEYLDQMCESVHPVQDLALDRPKNTASTFLATTIS